MRRVFSTCKRVYPGSCEVGCRPVVCSHPFLMSSRNAPGRALRDDTKNACVTDYCRPRQSLGLSNGAVSGKLDRHPETANAAHVGTMGVSQFARKPI